TRPPSLDADNLSEYSHTTQPSIGGSGKEDITSTKSESSPISTPQTNKRKSLQDRKLRPKSVTENEKNNLLRHSPPPDILSSSAIQEEDSVPELPSVSALQHLGKGRPKRPKKHAPTRGTIQIQEESSSSSIHEGLDKFFGSSHHHSPIHESNSDSPSKSSPTKLSCLTSSALDEEDDYIKPEKKSSGSISDLFARSKKKSTSDSPSSPPPLLKTTSLLDPESSSILPGRRPRSSLEDSAPSSPPSESEMLLSGGKKTPEEVARRHGVGLGGNMLAEMKAKQEKRSSAL
ncbi:Uncharacterized protein FKW44_024177, partial [Caligus rogercresseyi]